jgi:hypothetical protein
MPKVRSDKSPTYKLTVHLVGDRKSVHHFHTPKSARHYAKEICNNQNTQRITLVGPDLSQTLFSAEG